MAARAAGSPEEGTRRAGHASELHHMAAEIEHPRIRRSEECQGGNAKAAGDVHWPTVVGDKGGAAGDESAEALDAHLAAQIDCCGGDLADALPQGLLALAASNHYLQAVRESPLRQLAEALGGPTLRFPVCPGRDSQDGAREIHARVTQTAIGERLIVGSEKVPQAPRRERGPHQGFDRAVKASRKVRSGSVRS